MKKYHLYILCILSGLLLGFSWFPNGLLPVIFVAFVPLLVAEDTVCKDETFRSRSLFIPLYLCFLVWNLVTTWWLKNASGGGAVMAIGLNALIMATFFYIIHRIRRRIGKWGNIIFVTGWIAFEYIHLNWDLSWSWLTLGNVFADAPAAIQWYEYTGVLGGSLWVLIVNIAAFDIFLNRKSARRVLLKKASVLTLLVAVPLTWSHYIETLMRLTKGGDERKVVILQPNVDPYNVKFFLGFEEQLQMMLEQAKTKVDSTTDFLVFPETALTENIWEESIQESRSLAMLRAFMKSYPNLKIVIGANTVRSFGPNEEISETARKFVQTDGYYDVYNTGLYLDNTGSLQIYHKSLLVPGVERIPLQFIFKHFESLALDMGGTVGSLGVQKERSLFYTPDSSVRIAPVICYESIFGEYCTGYIKKGANLIMIITNDGWWGDTPGYKQHLRLGRLRAIETRRWIVRSANTGVSCFISPSGDMEQQTDYWVPATISGGVMLNSRQTFYVLYGDYLGRICFWTSLILLLYSLLVRFGFVKSAA